MRGLGLEQISLFGLPPVDCVHLAADLGCEHISGTLTSFDYKPPYYPSYSLQDDPALRREMIAAMRDRGVSIALGEGLTIRPGSNVRVDRVADLALMRELGVTRINTVSLDPDRSRSFDQFAALAEMAAQAGMETTLEPSPGLTVGDLPTALAAIRHVGRPDFRLLIDTMHLVRSGSGAADIAALDPDLIGYIQLCDAPLTSAFPTYMEEAMYERMVPGTGELPLVDILAALPSHLPIGLEVPLRSQVDAGIGPHERMGRCVEAARALIAEAEARAAG